MKDLPLFIILAVFAATIVALLVYDQRNSREAECLSMNALVEATIKWDRECLVQFGTGWISVRDYAEMYNMMPKEYRK